MDTWKSPEQEGNLGFCPSDGLVIEKMPDGSPSSLCNGWAASAVLEGLVETLDD